MLHHLINVTDHEASSDSSSIVYKEPRKVSENKYIKGNEDILCLNLFHSLILVS